MTGSDAAISGLLAAYDDKQKFVISAKAGDKLTVRLTANRWIGEEGPILVGIILMPNGESDGAPGGTIFDDVLEHDGEYEIVVSQNAAKSRATNIEFSMTVKLAAKVRLSIASRSPQHLGFERLPKAVKTTFQLNHLRVPYWHYE